MDKPVSRATIDPKMLELLACPLTKGRLGTRRTSELISKGARLAYPVRDGIPIMLPSEARSTEDPVPEGSG